MRRLTIGGWGWVCVPILVAVVDGEALRRYAIGRTEVPHTMSRSFFTAVRHPVRRWPVSLSVGGTLFHLFTGWNPLSSLGDALIKFWTPTKENSE